MLLLYNDVKIHINNALHFFQSYTVLQYGIKMKYDTILCLIRFNVYFINIFFTSLCIIYIYFIEIFASIKFSIITLLNRIIGKLEERMYLCNILNKNIKQLTRILMNYKIY